MSDIFREVDEALEKERVARLWKEYGPVLIVAIIALIVSTAAFSGYRAWKHTRDEKATDRLITALQADDHVQALDKAAADLDSSHQAVARLIAAGELAASEKFAEAAAAYHKIAEDRGAPSDLRDLATILAIRADGVAAPGKTDIKSQAETLAKIAKNDDSAFQMQAKMEAALLYGDGLKDYETALSLLKGFEDESATDSLTEKALALRHVYEIEAGKASSENKAANGAAQK